MKRAIKGFMIWILNLASIFTFSDLSIILFQDPSVNTFIPFAFAGLLWIITGGMIVVAFVNTENVHVKKGATEKELLSYSFVDNSILLSLETIQKNGFYEIWRQENDEHSVQILCFNKDTGEFQAFDRFHWMDEPIVVSHIHEPNVIAENPIPEGTYYKKDLWTPIKLHFTTEWLKEHMQ